MEIVMPQAEKTCSMPTFLVNRKVDGLIFMGEIDRRYLATAIQSGVPFMLLDFYDDAIAADCVLSDNTSGSYMLTEHLIATGRKSIGFVGSVQSTSSIMDRYLGYVKAMLRAGLPIRDDWRLEDRDDRGIFIPFTLPHEMPEAFVCNRDEVAYNLVETLKREGYRVPQDVAVTGYDDYRYSLICNPPGGPGRHGQDCGGSAPPQNGAQARHCAHRHRAGRLRAAGIDLIPAPSPFSQEDGPGDMKGFCANAKKCAVCSLETGCTLFVYRCSFKNAVSTSAAWR